MQDFDTTTNIQTEPRSNIKHSSVSQEWYSPKTIIESARKVMGSIDTDPASSIKANQVVQAKSFYTKEDDGLLCSWYGNVFLNPPGGKLKGKSLSKLFWERLMYESRCQRVKQAVVLAFSIELLQTSQLSDELDATDFMMCIPRRRLAFTDSNGNTVKSNTHASAIIYVNNNSDRQMQLVGQKLFADEFAEYGSIMVPYGV